MPSFVAATVMFYSNPDQVQYMPWGCHSERPPSKPLIPLTEKPLSLVATLAAPLAALALATMPPLLVVDGDGRYGLL